MKTREKTLSRIYCCSKSLSAKGTQSVPHRIRASPQAGFTLVEMMIAGIVIICVFTCLVFIAGDGCSRLKGPAVQRNAELQAAEYIRTVHPTWQNPRKVCQRQDLDGNGYVRCTLAGTIVQDGSSHEVSEQVECSAFYVSDTNHGCQRPRGIVVPNSGVSNQ